MSECELVLNLQDARLPDGLDLSAPDRVDDRVYNRILWLM